MTQEALERQLATARHFLGLERPQRALQALEEADEALLELPEYWTLRALAFDGLERPKDAERAAARGLELDPDDTDLLRLRGRALAEQGRLAEAERALLAALRIAPEDPSLLCTYALTLARADQLAKATRLVERAAQLAPDSRQVESVRLVLAHLRGEDRRAEGHARQLVGEAPDDPAGHYLMGVALQAQGQAAGAARHFREAAQLEPGDADYAAAARASRLARHPLMWPLLPLARLGAGGVWLCAIATLAVLYWLNARRALGLFALAYVAFCVYSWIVPPLLRRWLARRR